MPIPDNIKEMAATLHASAKRDLTPAQWRRVQAAMHGIQQSVKLYGEEGKVALSLCAADFAAE